MESAMEIKQLVKEKYGAIAQNNDCSSGDGCCGGTDYSMVGDDYTQLQGYVAEADMSLGCGMPTEFANIQAGQTVLDLGSGAGNDVFVARALVGETGHVIGLDMTEAMIAKANRNKIKLGYENVEFHLGDIENMPIADDTVDVIISNCVLNLVPDKNKAFDEMYRVLKPGGHFCVSDIVLIGDLPAAMQQAAEMYVGCVAGAMQKSDYIRVIYEAGFTGVSLKKERRIDFSDEVMRKYIPDEIVTAYRASGAGIFSVTVYAVKPIV